MIAYKLVRIKNGKLYSLFINNKVELPIGVWLKANSYPTKGFAIRQGWHCCMQPIAPHLKMNLASGEQRVWVECRIANFTVYPRPISQGGTWLLAQDMWINRVIE